MVNDIDFDTRSVPTNQKKKTIIMISFWKVFLHIVDGKWIFFFVEKTEIFILIFFFTFFIFLQFKKPLPITYSKRIFEFYLDSFYHYHVSVWLVGCLPPYNHLTNKIQFSFFWPKIKEKDEILRFIFTAKQKKFSYFNCNECAGKEKKE